jgi:hypothetical protein
VKNRAFNLLLILLIGVFEQGCVVWRYTDTPPVSGTVIDATSKQPIAGAKVGFKKHERLASLTAADGSFHARPSYVWRPCWILPGEFWRSSGLFFVQAPGYKPFEQVVDTSMGAPFNMVQPIAIKKDSQ